MGSLDATAEQITTALADDWSDSDLVRLLAEAVHEFETIGDPVRQEMFLAEPRPTGDVAWDAALAALAVHLVRLAGFGRTPDWTRKPERYTRDFRSIGLTDDSDLKAFVFQRTPFYFKARGVMLNEANLESV